MKSLHEHVVKRAFQYLDLSELTVDSATAREVLRIVDAEMEAGEDALLSRVLSRLEQRFFTAADTPLRATPALCRGSIGHT